VQLSSSLHRGSVITANQANPAVQTNWIYTFPAQFNYEVQFVRFTLTTDANAANRNIGLELRDPAGAVLWRGPHSFVHTASLAIIYYASQASPAGLILGGNAIPLVLPPHNLIAPLSTIRTYSVALQAGDQFSLIDLGLIRAANPLA